MAAFSKKKLVLVSAFLLLAFIGLLVYPDWQKLFSSLLLDEIRAQNLTLARALLFFGADPNYLDFDGTPALDVAARSGRLPIVQLLIEYGVDLNRKDMEGNTILHRLLAGVKPTAIQFPEVFECLAGSGADVNIQNKEGFTPLHYAVEGYIPKRIPRALMQANARSDVPNKDGLTALMICRGNQNWETEEVLLNTQPGPNSSHRRQ